MTVTTTTAMSNSVAAAYDRQYIDAFLSSRIWFELVDWGEPVGGNLRGSTINQPVLEQLDPATGTLTEGSDVTPVAMDDSNVAISIAEYGNVVQTTRFLSLTAFTDIERAAARAVGQNQARSLDLVIREVAAGGTLVIYPGTVTARTDLDTTNDKIDYEFVSQLVSMAASLGIPPFEDGTYATVVHPALFPDLAGITEWKAVGEYSDPKLIYMGKPGVLGKGGRFKNERGMLAGLRFVEHNLGKLFLGGGTPAQSATTLGAAATAGATSVTVADATGLAAGDWITIDKGQATEEQVLITAVSGTTLTIRGAGNGFTNFGLKYAHSSGAGVIEAPNVAALPIFGPNSLKGRYASDPGMNGEAAVEWASTNIPRRFLNHSWYWIGGFGRMEKWLLRAEVACTGHIYGDNK